MKAVTSLGLAASTVLVLGGSATIGLQIFLFAYAKSSDSQFSTGVVSYLLGCVMGLYILVDGVRRFREMLASRSKWEGPSSLQLAEDRLDELERLKRRDMVTPEEYAAKRQEILKDL
jgi:hypothetical protein